MSYFDYLKEVVEDIFSSNMDIKDKKKELEKKCECIELIDDDECRNYINVVKGYINVLETILIINESYVQLDKYEKNYSENINKKYSSLRLHELLNLKKNIEMFEQFYIDVIKTRINNLGLEELEKMLQELMFIYNSTKSRIMPDLEFLECLNLYLERINEINKNNSLSLDDMLKSYKEVKTEVQSLEVQNTKFIQGYIFHIINQINENIFNIANLGLSNEGKKLNVL